MRAPCGIHSLVITQLNVTKKLLRGIKQYLIEKRNSHLQRGRLQEVVAMRELTVMSFQERKLFAALYTHIILQ